MICRSLWGDSIRSTCRPARGPGKAHRQTLAFSRTKRRQRENPGISTVGNL